MNKKLKKERFELNILFTFIVGVFILISLALVGILIYLLIDFKLISDSKNVPFTATELTFIIILITFIVAVIMTFFLSKIPLKPINKVIDKMNQLSSGDFKVRIDNDTLLGRHPAIKEFTDSFNAMAKELQNMEILRNDFINNFSHEFKTPMVSIVGFTKLLKKDNLSEEEKNKYLSIIESESIRLSDMANKVLNMSKIEGQTILTNITKYNLSEQIRSCILLLETRWNKKNITFDINLDEYFIVANNEFLKQVWINLIDNAIKFTKENEYIKIYIKESVNSVSVFFENKGEEIPLEKQRDIFNKFYQLDESRSSKGNGIGLSLVKFIVDLHKGKVGVISRNNRNTFYVELPKNQDL